MGERHNHSHQQQQPSNPAARDVDPDDSMEDEDEDDDTVVGTCLHCSAPPPPRSSSRVSGSSSNPCVTSTSSSGRPCSNASTTAMTSFTASCPPPATRVQVSCDDCRSFICDGASILTIYYTYFDHFSRAIRKAQSYLNVIRHKQDVIGATSFRPTTK